MLEAESRDFAAQEQDNQSHATTTGLIHADRLDGLDADLVSRPEMIFRPAFRRAGESQRARDGPRRREGRVCLEV